MNVGHDGLMSAQFVNVGAARFPTPGGELVYESPQWARRQTWGYSDVGVTGSRSESGRILDGKDFARRARAIPANHLRQTSTATTSAHADC